MERVQGKLRVRYGHGRLARFSPSRRYVYQLGKAPGDRTSVTSNDDLRATAPLSADQTSSPDTKMQIGFPERKIGAPRSLVLSAFSFRALRAPQLLKAAKLIQQTSVNARSDSARKKKEVSGACIFWTCTE